MPSVACIYRITCRPTGRTYVGSTIHRDRRWRFHRWQLKRGTHHSFRLQRAWDKHGPDSFDFEVLETVENTEDMKTALESKERSWIDIFQPQLNRTTSVNRHSLGMRMGPLPEDRKRKISEAVTGFRHDEAAKAKMRGRRTGVKMTATQLANLSKFGGHTEESRQCISKAQIGKKHSQTTKDRRSASLKGRPWSDARRKAHELAELAKGLISGETGFEETLKNVTK